MLEIATNEQTRNAIAAAHAERAQVTREIWSWMFGAQKSR